MAVKAGTPKGYCCVLGLLRDLRKRRRALDLVKRGYALQSANGRVGEIERERAKLLPTNQLASARGFNPKRTFYQSSPSFEQR